MLLDQGTNLEHVGFTRFLGCSADGITSNGSFTKKRKSLRDQIQPQEDPGKENHHIS
jgi:hypothetical protein